MADTSSLILANEALIALGEPPIDDFDAGGSAATVARLTTQPIIDALLGSHPWTFNRQIVALNRLAEAPSEASGFAAAYQLPVACFRIVAAYVNGGRVLDWGEAGTTLLLDAGADDLVELEFHGRGDVLSWRPLFRRAVVNRLAAEFCIPITDDTVRAKLLHQLAELEMAKARHQNAVEKPAHRLPVGRWQARMAR